MSDIEQEIVYRVQENPDFIKDQETGAVLNTNVSKLKEYKIRKQQNAKISRIEDDIRELKELLHLVLERQQCQ